MMQLYKQLLPWGIRVYVYKRGQHLRKLEVRAIPGYLMGYGAGSGLHRVFLGAGNATRVGLFRYCVLTTQAIADYAANIPLDIQRNDPSGLWGQAGAGPLDVSESLRSLPAHQDLRGRPGAARAL